MGACTSKAKKTKEKHLKNDTANGGQSNSKKNSNNEQGQEQRSSTANADKFDNVPFIDSEDKNVANNLPAAPLASPSTIDPDSPLDNEKDERTTVKTNFETNVSYSSVETIEKLKQEVYDFIREKILPFKDEKGKLIDYVYERFTGNSDDKAAIDECLEACFHDIEQHQHPDHDDTNSMKKRVMNMVTAYVASQSSENSFLKALYDKMGPSLDLNTLNAETTEHEVVNVTVTKTVRQVFIDGSSTVVSDLHASSTGDPANSVINISNNQYHIPADLPDDIRLKAEQVLNSFNEAVHLKEN